jgi:hypothetical protein
VYQDTQQRLWAYWAMGLYLDIVSAGVPKVCPSCAGGPIYVVYTDVDPSADFDTHRTRQQCGAKILSSEETTCR